MLSQESGVRSQQLAAGNDNSDDDSDDDSGNINISDEQRGLSATMQGSSQSGSKRRNTIKELGLQQGSTSRRYCGAGGRYPVATLPLFGAFCAFDPPHFGCIYGSLWRLVDFGKRNFANFIYKSKRKLRNISRWPP